MTSNDQLPQEGGSHQFATERERLIALDIQIRTEQGEARRRADEALRAQGTQFLANGTAPCMQTRSEATDLPILAPPMLEAAMDYDRQGRLVAFYWGGGDEAYFCDGSCTACAEWDAFLLYTQHLAVAPALVGYDFGSSETEATHWLILDRATRRLSVAPASVAQQLVQAQWQQRPEPAPMLVLDDEAWVRLVTEVEARVAQITPQQIMEAMQAHQRLLAALRAWLDRQLLVRV